MSISEEGSWKLDAAGISKLTPDLRCEEFGGGGGTRPAPASERVAKVGRRMARKYLAR